MIHSGTKFNQIYIYPKKRFEAQQVAMSVHPMGLKPCTFSLAGSTKESALLAGEIEWFVVKRCSQKAFLDIQKLNKSSPKTLGQKYTSWNQQDRPTPCFLFCFPAFLWNPIQIPRRLSPKKTPPRKKTAVPMKAEPRFPRKKQTP